ncbi:right-handed parallel beta-helix repeat-containing protein [Sphingomonas bacterium]|uniref:right-handed parallel beta-helix repeat-containing protein n=1 Tax=Sphingomonas bacterium TaxID=1895847 RepID=UPI0015761FE2|nr:right-handed parallel beta-helix repeat-containing protein [Sphingomonas bacterium]
MRRILLAPLALAAIMLGAAAQPAPFSVDGHGYRSLDDALAAIGDRTATIVIAPGTYRECAVQSRGTVTYRAAQPGTAVFEHNVCEDKAALVLRGRGSVIDGLVFRGYEVNDGNGEGIRTEAGDLTVVNSMFLDSEQGIGGGTNDVSRRIVIDHSTFAGLGQCRTDNCSHSLYLITAGSVSVTNSRFERGTGGHYAKIRAAHVQVDGNSFDDSAGHQTSYLIDLSNGGTGTVRGNTLVQGKDKDNPGTLIAVSAENRMYPTEGLAIDGNTASLAPGAAKAAFVGDWSHQRLAIGTNRLSGLTPFVSH